MTNIEELNAAISASGLKKSFIAVSIGLSRTAFWKKCLNKTEFTASEVDQMRRLLNLNAESMNKIFFAS